MRSKTLNAHGVGRERTSQELRNVTIKGQNGTRTEMLPGDPMEVVKALRARKTPAQRAKARLAAEAKKRGV